MLLKVVGAVLFVGCGVAGAWCAYVTSTIISAMLVKINERLPPAERINLTTFGFPAVKHFDIISIHGTMFPDSPERARLRAYFIAMYLSWLGSIVGLLVWRPG